MLLSPLILGTAAAPVAITDAGISHLTVAAAPTVSGRLATATTFYAYVNVADGTCQIFIGTDANKTLYDLTDETDAGNI